MDGAIKTQKLLERHGLLGDEKHVVVFFAPPKKCEIRPLQNHTPQNFLLVLLATAGIYDETVAEVAKFGVNDKKLKNASRNIYNFIHKKDKTLPVSISSVVVPVRGKSRYKHIEERRPWPLLLLSDWVKTSFENPYGGFFFLGGYKLDQLDRVKDMLRRFWENHKMVDSNITPNKPEVTVPFYLHGDEGRGQCKVPVLVLAAQPIIGWGGEDRVNSKKYLVPKYFMSMFSIYKFR